MAIRQAMAVTFAVTGIAIGSASPAWADERLDGEYTFINGPTSNTWSITTQCNPEGTCGGSVSSSSGMLVAIHRLAGGPWTIERHDVFNGWTCADGKYRPGGSGVLLRSGEPGGDDQLHVETRGVQRPQLAPESAARQPGEGVAGTPLDSGGGRRVPRRLAARLRSGAALAGRTRCGGRTRRRCGKPTRARTATEGFGARLLALQDADGQWAGGAFFPADFDFHGPEAAPGAQPWTATTWTLNSLREWGIDAEVLRERRTAELLAANSRWEYEDRPYWSGEVDCCINAWTVANGVWLGADVTGIVDWFLEHQLSDGGWNCEWVEGSTRSSFHSTLNSLKGLARL